MLLKISFFLFFFFFKYQADDFICYLDMSFCHPFRICWNFILIFLFFSLLIFYRK